MKQKYFYLIAALAMAMMTQSSCISDDFDPEVVRLSVEGLGNNATTRAASTDALQNTQFVSGLGIQVEAYATGGTSTYATAVYNTTSDEGSTSGSILLSPAPTPIYYHPTSNIDICAFYPSSVASASTTTFTVNTNQTTASIANYQSSDLMYATKLTNKAKGSTHGLTFNHAMSQIIVNLQAGTGLTPDDITTNVTAVKINNTIPTANLEFAVDGSSVPTGVVTATASGSVGDIDITGDKASNVGIIVPQTVTSGKTLFTITYNSHDYTYALTANQPFAAGNKYTYTFTLNLAGLQLESVSINDWTAGGSESSDIPL